MININSNKKYVDDLVSKNNGVYISPEEYTKYAQQSSSEEFDTIVGAKNQPTTAYGRNRVLDNRVRVFRKEVPLPFVDGVATIPTDCRQVLSISVAGVPIKPLDEDRSVEILRDPLAKPDARDRYYSEKALKYQLVGETGSFTATIEYLREPAKPVYGYTNPTGRRAVYDPATSTDFDWDEAMEPAITSRILAKVGLSMSNGTVMQVANNNIIKE